MTSEHHPRIWRAVLDKSGGRCIYCGCWLRVTRTFPSHARVPEILGHYLSLEADPPPSSASIDHLVALSKGGATDLSNLVPACMVCNQLKGNRSLERFRWIVAFQRRGVPPLTREQIAFLLEAGFDLAAHLPVRKFWFEEAGITIA